MSNFTTEVRFICESLSGAGESKGFDCIDEVLRKSVEKVFNFDYPIFDEKYRIPLESKILKYYYTREISEETVGLWKLRLSNRLNLIMPYYNQLYESALIKFNPLYDVDLKTTHTRTNDNIENTTKSGEVHNTHTNETITDFDKSATKNSTSNTDGSLNKTYKNSETINGTNGNTVVTDESTKFTPGVTKTNTDSGWSHNDLHILESHVLDHETSTETHNDTTTTTPNVTVTNTGNKWDYYSDTPQGGVGNLENHSYLTNARNNTDTNTETTTGNTGVVNNGGNTLTKNSLTESNDSHVTEYSDNRTKTESFTGFDNTDHDNTVTTTGTNTENKTNNGEEHSDDHSKTIFSENDTETNDTTTTNTGNYNVTNTEQGNNTFNGVEEYIQNVVGKTSGVSYSKMLLEFRETFLNIDKMIIDNLSDLFFGLYE